MVYIGRIWQNVWRRTNLNELSSGRGFENTYKHFFIKGFDYGIESTVKALIKGQCVICNKNLEKDLGKGKPYHYPLCRKHREIFIKSKEKEEK